MFIQSEKTASTRPFLFVERKRVAGCFALIVLALLTWGARTHGDEFSILKNSTIIGRSFGLPPTVDFYFERSVGDLRLNVESLFFAKNLELTGSPRIDGESFFGFLAPIRFNYLASERVQIEIGGYFGRNYGDDDSLDITQPLARLIFQPVPGQTAIAGSLIQSHPMHDALRDDIVLFRDSDETGLQYRVDWERLKTDYWIDWRVRETEQRSEEFDVAGVTQLRLGRLWVSGEFIWSHTGGQKNTMGEVANGAAGMFGLSYNLENKVTGIPAVRVGANYLVSHFESRSSPTTSGQGIEYWTNVDIPVSQSQWVRIFGSQYRGNGLLATRGDPLYRFNEYSQVGFDWVSSIANGIDMEFGFVGQYADGTFMNTYRLYFVWQNSFRLKCFNQRQFDSIPIYSFDPPIIPEEE